MQFEATISDNKLNYFSKFCTNVQNTANASIKFIKQNETVQKTAEAVKEYAPYVIGFVGSYFAPVAVTVGCLTATFVIAVNRPQYISKQTFGKVFMGVGASMFLSALKTGIALRALNSFSIIYAGKKFRDAPARW